jgi:cell division septation protein DedD
MKWLAFGLLVINGALWFHGDSFVPKRVVVVAERQALPRVADLRTVSPAKQEEPVPEQSVSSEAALGQVETVVEPKEPVPQRYCVRLGWFENDDVAREAYLALGSPGVAYEVREEERELTPLHWVIVPPQPADRALALFRDLQSRGIDSYLVRRGENKNAISLGLFESRQAAETVLDEKKRQNLNAILANFPRNQISYALVFEDELMPDSGAVEAVESDYANNFDLVEIRRCEGVATVSENP